MEYTLTGLLPTALLIDLPEIDVQHEEIFRRIEMLKTSSFGNGPASLDEFHSLLDYLEWHFASEERVARQLGIDFADHARVHDDNLRTLRKALAAVHDGRFARCSFLPALYRILVRASYHRRRQALRCSATGVRHLTSSTACSSSLPAFRFLSRSPLWRLFSARSACPTSASTSAWKE
ncbi:hemerythrin family protein [Accumulibacter sp.]|uniref:hemerythrin family protein n=1 Tax=Accumulibacter sp. TaxID=2053492 RepID=UPI001AC4F460|nr:hemerythrin family protein [Accumulibacter sp.]MBN8514580.1 hemerythrin family protein [Accumulibacter sp.]